MKIIKIILVLALLQWCTVSCYKEDVLTPTEETENVYNKHTLPQGNHDYDTEIVALFQKYNTLFLYKYVPHDLYYNKSEWLGGIYDSKCDSIIRTGLFDVPADESYVGDLLVLLKDIWLRYYPDSFLKNNLPGRVFMLDSLFWIPAYCKGLKGHPQDYLWNNHLAYAGGDYIAVTWGGERIEHITPDEWYKLKSAINSVFLAKSASMGGNKPTDAFLAVSDYSVSVPWWEDGYKYGFIKPTSDKQEDWNTFIEAIVSNTYDILTSSGENGFLHPDKDINGLIRQKYDIIIEYFLAVHEVDLQAIGNAVYN